MAELKLTADSGGGTVSLKSPATTTDDAAVQLTLPVDDGTTGQYLKTDGSGALSWETLNASNLSSGTLPDARFPATLPAVSGANLTGIVSPLNNRNILINGAMRIRQRDDVANAGNEYGGPDRWFFWKNDGAFNIAQVDQVPTGQGFKNSYHIDCTSASGASGAYYVGLIQKIEGKNVMRLKYGSSNAESLTLSFWIKSTKTGTYIATLRNKDKTKHISKSYTVNDADTWEKKTITFAGDTTAGAEFDNDVGESLTLVLWVFAGSSYTSGTLATSWATTVDANEAVGQVNAGDNASNNIYFTGIQLEPGTSATEFEFKGFGTELAECQRYYQQYYYGQNANGDNTALITAHCWSTSQIYGTVQFPVRMRSTPTGDVTNGTGYWYVYKISPDTTTYDTMSVWNASENAAILKGTDNLAVTAGQSVFTRGNNAAARFAFKAEL